MLEEQWKDSNGSIITIAYSKNDDVSKNLFAITSETTNGKYVNIFLNRHEICCITEYLEHLLYVDMIEWERSD